MASDCLHFATDSESTFESLTNGVLDDTPNLSAAKTSMSKTLLAWFEARLAFLLSALGTQILSK